MKWLFPLFFVVALAGCGGTGGTGTPVLTPDFSLSVSPATVSLQAGSSAQVSVSATAVNGFSGTVSLSVMGLPAGVTVAPTTATLAPGTPQTLTLTAAASTALGTTVVTFTGTSGSTVHTATVSLSITAEPPPPDFSLSVTPSSVALTGGSTGSQITVLATAVNGFTGAVAVALSGLPAGVTASPATLSLTAGMPQTVTLTASSAAVAASATVTVTGSSGTLSHTASLALTVAAAPPPPDFSLSVTPSSVALTGGSTGSQITVLATPVNGFTGTVAVALSGLPAGVTASPATLSLTAGVPQTVTLTAASSVVASSGTVTFAGTSGTLSHTATLALTVAAAPPPPDFALSVTPSTAALTAGNAGSQISVLATAENGFTGTVAVGVSGLPAGVTASPATLNLSAGAAQAITLTAANSAAVGAATVTFTGTSGTLSHAATLALTVASATGPDVVTYHYDNTRQGLNAQETLLTLSNVNSSSFGLLGVYPVDGRVDAQPLYAGGLSFKTGTPHTANVVFVATEHGSVYALDAATGVQEWKTSVLGAGETTSDDHNCGQITPEIGITSTPVIDRAYGPNGAIFVVGMSKDAGGGYHQRLHALDLTTGAELPGSPTEIAATYPGTGEGSQNGTVVFAPGQYAERAGLLLLQGTIYLAWTSHCDYQPYTGWVMGYSESTLQQTSVLNLTPNGSEGSIWMSGYGMAADSDGYIYFLDANGTLDTGLLSNGYPDEGDFGNAMLKLSAGNGLAVADFFEPYNTVAESNSDTDLGSGGAMVLPDVTGNGGGVHHLLVGAGKDGHIYVANRDFLGGFNPNSNGGLYQDLPGALPSGVWAGPAYFNNTVYYGAVGDVLRAFSISNGLLSTTPTSKSAASFPYPGATPSVSASGTSNAIVWAVESGTGTAAVLHAFDATNLAHELYNSNQAANNRDAFGLGNKFITPVVTNGMVFVGTPSGVAVFGLLP